MDLYAFFEKLHTLWGYARRRRFFPIAVTGLATVVYSATGLGDIVLSHDFKPIVSVFSVVLLILLWIGTVCTLPHEKRWLQHAEKLIDICDFDGAERTLNSPPLLIGFSARIKQLAALSRLKTLTGDLEAAHAFLLDVETEALLPEERSSLQLARASIMVQAGNYLAFRKSLAEFESRTPMVGDLRFRYLMLKSHEQALNGQYSSAKELLEEAIEIAPEPKFAAVSFNELARLEDSEGNDTNARSYYERAWQILRANPMPSLYPVVGHNLLIKYGQSGAIDKATNLLNEYRAMVLPQNTQQYIQFLNDQVHLARQIGNFPMLLDTYELIQRDLLQRLDITQRLPLIISELRMRFNDSLPFGGRLTEAVSLLKENNALSTKYRFQALGEILVVLRQCGAMVDGKDVLGVQNWVMAELMGMEEEIDVQLRNIPPVLPVLRDMWYGY